MRAFHTLGGSPAKPHHAAAACRPRRRHCSRLRIAHDATKKVLQFDLRLDDRLDDIIRLQIMMIAAGYEDGNDADSLRHDPSFNIALERGPDTEGGRGKHPYEKTYPALG